MSSMMSFYIIESIFSLPTSVVQWQISAETILLLLSLLHLCVLVVVMMMVVIGMKGRRGRLHKRLSVEPERTQRL